MGLGHWLRVVANHPRPARLVAARFLEWTGLSPLLSIPLDGYRLRFYPTNLTSTLWINPSTRVHDLSLFKDYCRAGDTVVDVGANVGEVSIIASQRVGRGGRVFSFEPNPRIYRYLLGNLSLNHCANVMTFNEAVGAAPGAVRMSDEKWDDMNRIMESGSIEVPCSTLDARLGGSNVALLKIDVEGSELRVLEGARSVLARTQCVNCEMGETHYRRYGYGMCDLIGFLQDQGFGTYVSHERRLRRVDRTFGEPGGHELVAARDEQEFVRRTGWTIE